MRPFNAQLFIEESLSKGMSEVRRPRSKGFVGFLFVAFMFFGLGVGILIGEVAPALFVGMGLGFLSMAILDAIIKEPAEEGSEYERAVESYVGRGGFLGNIILALLGIGFILGGLSILTGFEIEWRILGGALIILLGIWFIILAMRAIASSKSS
jgi:hypothetical protein